MRKIFYFITISFSIFIFFIFIEQLCPGAGDIFISDKSFCSMAPKLKDIIDLNSSLSDRLSMVNSSEGFRIYMFLEIFKYALLNPFTGSGFLGCWIMVASGDCSAHSQYGDVLFRTGFVGFFIYLYILFQIFRYLKKYHRDLFFGFIGALIFGVFNETFKLSHGAFILTFLIGLMFSKKQKMNSDDIKKVN
jgi:O-antigen ligase